jgi:Ribonuclease G/E
LDIRSNTEMTRDRKIGASAAEAALKACRRCRG